MDHKYLSEIKAREQAATPGSWSATYREYECPYECKCGALMGGKDSVRT